MPALQRAGAAASVHTEAVNKGGTQHLRKSCTDSALPPAGGRAPQVAREALAAAGEAQPAVAVPVVAAGARLGQRLARLHSGGEAAGRRPGLAARSGAAQRRRAARARRARRKRDGLEQNAHAAVAAAAVALGRARHLHAPAGRAARASADAR